MITCRNIFDKEIDVLPYLTDMVITSTNYLRGVTDFTSKFCFSWDRTGSSYERWRSNVRYNLVGSLSYARLGHYCQGEIVPMNYLFCHCRYLDEINSKQVDNVLRSIDNLYRDYPDDTMCGGIFLDIQVDTPAFRSILGALKDWQGTIYYDECSYS